MQDLKTPKTGSGTDSGKVTAAMWIFCEDVHAVLGARPLVQPPGLVASYEDPTQILMVSFTGKHNLIPQSFFL